MSLYSDRLSYYINIYIGTFILFSRGNKKTHRSLQTENGSSNRIVHGWIEPITEMLGR